MYWTVFINLNELKIQRIFLEPLLEISLFYMVNGSQIDSYGYLECSGVVRKIITYHLILKKLNCKKQKKKVFYIFLKQTGQTAFFFRSLQASQKLDYLSAIYGE